MRIVYVEDNQANVFLVKRVARMGGHDIINYIDGEEALSNITRDQPNLILMDIQLAGEMSGLQVVEKLREDGFEKPIIAVTAYAMVGDRERCLTAGCNDYIAKPLSIPLLIELMDYYNGKAAGKDAGKEADNKTEAEAPAAPQINGTGTHTPAAAAPTAVPVPQSAPTQTPAPAPAPTSSVSPTPVISVSAPVPPTPTVSPAVSPAETPAPQAPTPTPAAPVAPAATSTPTSASAPAQQTGQGDTAFKSSAVAGTTAGAAKAGGAAADKALEIEDDEGETEIINVIVERKPETTAAASPSASVTETTRAPETTEDADDQSATLPSREVSESTTKS